MINAVSMLQVKKLTEVKRESRRRCVLMHVDVIIAG